MDEYFGTKLIKAKIATYGEYRKEKYGDKQFETNISDDTPGYMVQYSDDYISWSPARVFEETYKLIHGELNELKLGTDKYTYVVYDEERFNAPHNYLIYGDQKLLCGIHFQEGPINENELNGIFMEDLINICIDRLEKFQDSIFNCSHNETAINLLKGAITALNQRTEERKKRQVEGTSKP